MAINITNAHFVYHQSDEQQNDMDAPQHRLNSVNDIIEDLQDKLYGRMDGGMGTQ